MWFHSRSCAAKGAGFSVETIRQVREAVGSDEEEFTESAGEKKYLLLKANTYAGEGKSCTSPMGCVVKEREGETGVNVTFDELWLSSS